MKTVYKLAIDTRRKYTAVRDGWLVGWLMSRGRIRVTEVSLSWNWRLSSHFAAGRQWCIGLQFIYTRQCHFFAAHSSAASACKTQRMAHISLSSVQWTVQFSLYVHNIRSLCGYRKQIARQLRRQYIEGIYSNSVILKSRLGVTQSHWKWHHSIDRIRFPVSVPE